MAQHNSATQNVIETILNTRTVTPEQVIALRRHVWPDGVICRREAEVIFEINDTVEKVCGEWRDFFAEAMVAHMVEQAEPRGYISREDAAWFCSRILIDHKVHGETELETLIQLLEKATDSPQSLELQALNAVRDAVLRGEHKVLGNARLKPGVLGDPEVALLRRILYAKAAGRSEAISKEEAELLFDLNDATANEPNCPAWSALFVNAISNYLLVHSGYEPPSRERMKRVDLWLNQPGGGVRGFMRSMLEAPDAASFDIIGNAAAESPMEEYYRTRSYSEKKAQTAAEKVTAEEAKWLIDRINRDGALTLNEIALLHFLKESDIEMHPSMNVLFKRVN